MTDMRDELLEQVVSELRTLPPVDEAAVQGIVRAAAADGAVRGPRFEARGPGWWRSRVPLAAAAGLTLAAGLGGFFAGDAIGDRPTTVIASQPVQASESITTLASAQPSGLRAQPSVIPTQFVLDAPRASRVALVGDFNEWDAAATPLTRDPSSGIWTATVPLTAGRHVYAFMVDGSLWTLDPRAPTTQDPDFGTPSSVVLVGAP